MCVSKPKVPKPKPIVKAPSPDDAINEQKQDVLLKGRQSGGRVATILAASGEGREVRSARRVKLGA